MRSSASSPAIASERLVPTPPFGSLKGLIRAIAISGISGLAAGIAVGGVGGRVFMRIAGAAASASAQGRTTEAGFRVGEVTVGGSIGLVVFIGIFVGIFGAVTYVVLSPWLSWTARFRGAAFGVVLFALASATSDMLNPDNFDFDILENGPLLVTLIGLLFLSFGVGIDLFFRFLDRRLPDGEDGWSQVGAVYVAFALLGLLATAVFVPFALFSSDVCGCEPPLGASWSFVVAALGTLFWWVSVLVPAVPLWVNRASAVLGYGGTAGVVLFGLVRALSDAAEIVN